MSEAADGGIHTVTYIEVAPASVADVARVLRQWRDANRNADGNIRLDVLRRTSPDHHFAVVGGWKSRAQLDADRDGANGRSLRDQLGPHLIAGIDTRIHNAQIGGPVGGQDRPRKNASLWVVTHVDVPPPNKDACIALLEAQVKASRGESGSASFEVFQQSDRPNHFSVVEGWDGAKSYDGHIMASHTRAFRQQLTPLSGALYDERSYALEG